MYLSFVLILQIVKASTSICSRKVAHQFNIQSKIKISMILLTTDDVWAFKLILSFVLNPAAVCFAILMENIE